MTALAWVSLTLAFVTPALIMFAILGLGNRQRMAVMEVVWPVTALCVGPLAWVAYRRWGRPNSLRFKERTATRPDCGRGRRRR